MTEELKPCPFCGGKARTADRWNIWTDAPSAYCTECGAVIVGSTEQEAAKAWNRRTSDLVAFVRSAPN